MHWTHYRQVRCYQKYVVTLPQSRPVLPQVCRSTFATAQTPAGPTATDRMVLPSIWQHGLLPLSSFPLPAQSRRQWMSSVFNQPNDDPLTCLEISKSRNSWEWAAAGHRRSTGRTETVNAICEKRLHKYEQRSYCTYNVNPNFAQKYLVWRHWTVVCIESYGRRGVNVSLRLINSAGEAEREYVVEREEMSVGTRGK